MTIHFPDRPAPWYDVDSDTITFPVRVDGRPLACVVTAAELVERFTGRPHSSPADALVVFESHRDALRRLAEDAIRDRGSNSPCEEFVIRLSDREP